MTFRTRDSYDEYLVMSFRLTNVRELDFFARSNEQVRGK